MPWKRKHGLEYLRLDRLHRKRLRQPNNLKEQVSLKTNWLFHPSIDFYVKTGYADWLILYPYTKETDTACTASYYYALESEYPNLQDNYEVVQKMSWDRWLLKHR